MSAAMQRMAALRLTAAGPGPRRALSVPLPGEYAPSPASIPEVRSATDPRWVVAARAAALLQGGRAAFLAPDQRRRIVAMAQGLGLRAFDAGLIIAIVQDAARCGLDPLGMTTEGSLGMIRRAGPASNEGRAVMWLLLASACAGAGMFWGMLAWIGAR